MLFHIFIEGKPNHGGGQTGDDDLAPEIECRAPLCLRLALKERVEFFEVQHDDGKNRAELNHNEEHIHECRRHIEPNELIDEDHMPRTRDRQPLRQSLHDAQNDNLHQFHQ